MDILPKMQNAFTKMFSPKIYPEITGETRMQFDGCSKGNPGLAGAGAVIYKFNEEIWWESVYVGEKMTNNYAEYSGLILGLKKAIELGITDILVEGDSMLIIKQMKGEYTLNSENLSKLYKEAIELSKQFNSIHYTHIYRKYNTRADYLSNVAIQKVF